MIELKDIYKIYSDGDSEIRALDGINLHVDEGEFVAIVGQSGSGKSTAMNIIGCLDVPTSGKYYLDGEDVSEMNEIQLADIRSRRLGFIFQQYNLIPKLTLVENVELPLIYKSVKPDERRRRAMESLEKVGLADRAGKYPSAAACINCARACRRPSFDFGRRTHRRAGFKDRQRCFGVYQGS